MAIPRAGTSRPTFAKPATTRAGMNKWLVCCRNASFSSSIRPRRAEPRRTGRQAGSCRAALAEPSQPPSSTLTSRPVKAPQTDAKLLEAASLLPNQLFLRGKELLGGPEVEESALRKCVELHEKWQRGEKGPVMNKRWQGENDARLL